MAAMKGSRNGVYQTTDYSGEVVRTIRADETSTTVSVGSPRSFRIAIDPNATGTAYPERKAPKRVGDILLFEDGSWMPLRKLNANQKRQFGL